MHFCHFFRTITFFSVVISALIDYSDFIQPDGELEPLLVDPNTPFDPNAPLFDGGFSSSDPLALFDQSTDSENTSSDMLWDDSFKLASCSTLSRVRRADDSGSCSNINPSDNQQIIQSLLQGKFSITCTLLTVGVLPFALMASDGPDDVIMNMNTLNSVATIGLGPRLYYPSTLYRATLIADVAGVTPPYPPAWCCQTYEPTTLLLVTGFNCVSLDQLLSPPGDIPNS